MFAAGKQMSTASMTALKMHTYIRMCCIATYLREGRQNGQPNSPRLSMASTAAFTCSSDRCQHSAVAAQAHSCLCRWQAPQQHCVSAEMPVVSSLPGPSASSTTTGLTGPGDNLKAPSDLKHAQAL